MRSISVLMLLFAATWAHAGWDSNSWESCCPTGYQSVLVGNYSPAHTYPTQAYDARFSVPPWAKTVICAAAQRYCSGEMQQPLPPTTVQYRPVVRPLFRRRSR